MFAVRPKTRPCLAALAVAALAVAVYANSLTNGFTFDDHLVIVNNPRAWSWPGWSPFFTREYFDLTPELSYRPVCTLSYYFDYYVINAGRTEGRAASHHLSSVLSHALNAVLLLFLLRSLGTGDRAAFVASALFAVHPVGSEAVNGIGFREDILAFGFVAAALLCRQTALSGGKHRTLAAAGMALFAMAGAFSKETAVLAPALAWLCDAARGFPPRERRWRWATIGALGVVAVLYLAVRFGPMSHGLERSIEPWGGGLGYALLGAANAMLLYGRLMLVPLGLNIEHTPPTGRELGVGGAAPGLLFVAVYLLATLKAYRRRPFAFFALAWCGLWLLPVAHFLPIANPMAERFLYAPLAGFCLLMAVAFSAAFAHPSLPKRARPPSSPCLSVSAFPAWTAWALFAAAAICLSAITVARNPDWRHERGLYRSAVLWNPSSARAQNNLGDVYRADLADEETREGFRAMAEAQFRHALDQDPDYHSARFNLGLLWSLRGEHARALPHLEIAARLIEREPAFPWTVSMYRHQLGIAHWNLGDHALAIEHLRSAVEANPNNRRARQDLEKAEAFLRKNFTRP